MREIEAVSKAKQQTQKGTLDEPEFGFEQRHESNDEHYRTTLFVGQSRIGFVSIEVVVKVGPKKSADGYLTLSPAEAKALANALNELADIAEKDRSNPEYQKNIIELPQAPLS